MTTKGYSAVDQRLEGDDFLGFGLQELWCGSEPRRAALSYLRDVTSNLRAASLHFEPECFCICHSSRGSARHIMVLVTTRSALTQSAAPHLS
jgi:hypothetical protein